MLKKKKFLTLLLTSEKTELSDDFNTLKDLILFLIKYAFILNDTTSYNNFLKREFPKHEELFFKNSNVARYLDPKYSRWLSTDPALGDYASGSDAGCGGIYNHVNLSLYHYGGNNPIKYVDPDGNYIILNESQNERTKNFVESENSENSSYFGLGNEKYIPMGYYFSSLNSDRPQTASSFSNSNRFSLSMSSPFDSMEINPTTKLSMTGNLENGFELIEKNKETYSSIKPKVYAYISEKNNGKAKIDVIIEIDNNTYSGTVAYAGLSEVQTNGKDDKVKIDRIANDSINFLRRTSNETKNLTE